MEYNIIWLDDRFGIPGDPMETMYSNFMSSQKKGRYTSFHVEVCTSSNEMKALIQQNKYRYQAAILDVFGYTDADHPQESAKPFFEMMNFLKECDIIVKIFSGELEKDANRAVIDYIESHGLERDKDYFLKGFGYQNLFKVIENELDSKLSLYKQHPEILDLFRKGYLPKTAKKLTDVFLEDYQKHDSDVINKGYFRELYLIILDALVEDGILDDSQIREKQRFGMLFQQLSYEGKYDHITQAYRGMNVEDEICPPPVKHTANYLGKISRNLHHLTENGENIFAAKYYETLMDSAYSSMMIILLWFYSYKAKRDDY